ncbi:hypothetical protein LCGC14_3029680 [marine sediment metagenome]|uniref:Uncharacterized protein n=1 Tax=marine sediment metagenome TaxID=412755 RepID=A0A0F8Z0M1_9ZZZZ
MKNEATTDIFPDIHGGEKPVTYCDLLEVILRRDAAKMSDLLDIWPIIQVMRKCEDGEPIELSHAQWGMIDDKFNEGKWPTADSFCQLAVALQAEMASS